MLPFPIRSRRTALAAAAAFAVLAPVAAPAEAARSAKSPVVIKATASGKAKPKVRTFRSDRSDRSGRNVRTVTRRIRAKRVGRRTAVFPVRRLRRAKVMRARVKVRQGKRKRYKVRAKRLQRLARRGARRVKVRTPRPISSPSQPVATQPADVVLVVTVPAPGPTAPSQPDPEPEPESAPVAPALPQVTGALGRPSGDWRPYSDDSPFNQPVGSSPQLAPNSAGMVNHLLSDGSADSLVTIDGTGSSRSSDYSRPLYWSTASDPVYTVKCTRYGGRCPILGQQVRIPAQAQAAGGTDGHLTVVDNATGTEWSFFAVESKPAGGGELRVGWGRKCSIAGDGTGCGGGAAEFGGLAGRIRWEELALAVQRRTGLRHALFMTVNCTQTTYIWPATKEEDKGGCDTPDAPEMGRRFYLDMSDAEIDALRIPEWRKVVARTLATYGAFVGDQGGTSFGFQFESGQSWLSMGLANPFVDFAKANPEGIASSSGVHYYKLRDGIPWNRLRALAPTAR